MKEDVRTEIDLGLEQDRRRCRLAIVPDPSTLLEFASC